MPKSQTNSQDEGPDEKTTKIPPTQPKATVEPARDHEIGMISEGDRILGITKENSGWDVYNNEARKVDTELVKDWTTSLNFLLIFAAIFAAVLTALIVESKKMLEPDQIGTMVDVMIFYTNNVANGTHAPYNRTEFEPGTPAVVINCLFFGSLSASLLAALASVIALQWVADYDAAITRGGSSPVDRAKRRQFRHAGVVSWKMSEIIAALPLLLYFSVTLFFAGLVLWMWDTNRAVGIVVAGGTGLAVLFYVASTLIAVTFVSAPFRTPLSRWVYSFLHLPFQVLYWLLRAIRVSTIPRWVETRHLNYKASHKREDQAVEHRETLAIDALVWLANQLSLSQDSYRRLLLLVAELPNLQVEHPPALDTDKTLWYRIFDLLGWTYLKTGPSAIVDMGGGRDGMRILQRCYKLPVVQKLVYPTENIWPRSGFHYSRWSKFRRMVGDGPWRIPNDVPNHLFLLLWDLPCPVDFSAHEMEVTERVYQWRDQGVKDPRVWDEIFSDASSHPSEFFSSCVTIFGNYCSEEVWSLELDGMREIFTSIARKAVQAAVLVDDLLPLATWSLLRAYVSLVTRGYVLRHWNHSLWVISPFEYGKRLREASANDHRTHESLILLLSRQIGSISEETTAPQADSVIQMLWLRHANPVLRNWEDFANGKGGWTEMDMKTTSDWIRNADSIPHILEILRHLATAQQNDTAVGPLWRSTAPNEFNDPHFIDALQTFDRLMGMDCTNDDHRLLINLVCQDLELETRPDFDDYFTRNRLDSFALIKDPCLQILVRCARGPDFLSPVHMPDAYQTARISSLNRVTEFVYEEFSSLDSPAASQLQASLLPFNRNELYTKGLQDVVIFDLLQRIFRYPVTCHGCPDGPHHLVSHLLVAAGGAFVGRPVTLFGKISLERRYMALDLIIIISTLSVDEILSLAGNFPNVDEYVLRTLLEESKEIQQSQFLLLMMVLNSLRTVSLFPENAAAILVGVQKALQLPSDCRSTLLLTPLSLMIRQLSDRMLAREVGSFVEREIVKEQAAITIQLLLTSLAVRTIFGGHNVRRIACARAAGNVPPAVGWIAPHEM